MLRYKKGYVFHYSKIDLTGGNIAMKIEQFVVAYGVEQDRLRAFLPDGFESLRPVLRINVEIRHGDIEEVYLELNTAVEAFGNRGWLNVGHWDSETDGLTYQRKEKAVTFLLPFLTITYTGVGIEGSCPAEKDNGGCYFISDEIYLRPSEQIFANKEFCDCEFAWRYTKEDAHGVSIGKTIPAFPTEPKIQYPKQAFTPQNAAAIPCEQVLGAYKIIFERENERGQ